MSPEELSNLKGSEDQLLNMILAEKEMDVVESEVQKHIEEVKKLASSNIQQKKELDQLAEQYETKYAQYICLKDDSDNLKL